LPLAALIVQGRSPHFSPGQHGSTFGGNPVAAAAANQVIATIESGKLMKRAIEMGALLRREVETIPGVTAVRGRGLLLGIVLNDPIAKDVVAKLAENRVLANAPTDYVIRIAPPLIIGKREVGLFAKTFEAVLQDLAKK
ncbi:MAG: aminotransferase class III-fold pyridoxal phosphate-dependent enzyme, partial [Actinomycetota bacterium]